MKGNSTIGEKRRKNKKAKVALLLANIPSGTPITCKSLADMMIERYPRGYNISSPMAAQWLRYYDGVLVKKTGKGWVRI